MAWWWDGAPGHLVWRPTLWTWHLEGLLSKEMGEGPRLCCPSRVGRSGPSGHLIPGNSGGRSHSPKAVLPPGGQSQEAAGGTKVKEWTPSPLRTLAGGRPQGLGDGQAEPVPYPATQGSAQDPRIKVTQPAGLAQSPSCITSSGCSSGVSPITGSADLPQPLRGFLPPIPLPSLPGFGGKGPTSSCLPSRLESGQKPGSSPEMVLAGTGVGLRCGARGRNLREGMPLGAS